MAVIGFHAYPLASLDTTWDAGEQTKNATPEDLKKMCAWYDSDKPDLKGSYKFPHHMLHDFATNFHGCANAMARLSQADIPDSDRRGVYEHLAKHYREFKKEPPAYKSVLNNVMDYEEKIFEFKNVGVGSYNETEHSMIFTITSNSLDYYGEKVNPAGMQLPTYLDSNGMVQIKQPKALAFHKWDQPGIGYWAWIKYVPENNNILAKLFFDQDDSYAIYLEKKYSKKIMTDVSIGFKTDRKSITTDENDIPTHNLWILMEISLCTIGANPDAQSLSYENFEVEECELIIKSTKNSDLKKYFEEIKTKKIMDLEKEQKYKDAMSEMQNMIDTMQGTLKDHESRIAALETGDGDEPAKDLSMENILETARRILLS